MSQPNGRIYEFGHFRLDAAEHVLLRDGETVAVPPKAFALLLVLVERHGHLLEKGELLQRVWPGSYVEEANLSYNISLLRKALGDGEDGQRFIETVPKRGYRFVADVRDLPNEVVKVSGQEQPGFPALSQEWGQVPSGEELVVTVEPGTEVKRQPYELGVAKVSEANLVSLPLRPGPRLGQRRKTALLALVAVVTLAAVWFLLALRGGETKEAASSLRQVIFTQLTEQPGEESFPSLSPDGWSFVYASRAAGNWDIYLQRAGGRNPINLTTDFPFDDTQPAFSPDGESIAFRSERGGGGIFIMGATGESTKRLTDFGYNPAWSPDGKEVLVATNGIVNPSSRHLHPSQLWAVRVATGARRLLSEGDAVQPCWSPHGYRIAFWGLQKGGQQDLWTIPANGGEAVPVTEDEFVDWNPVWSPDGRFLYFVSNRGGSMNLWRVAVEERSGKVVGQPEPVTTPAGYCEQLSISRDGRRLAYVQGLKRANLQKVGFDPAAERVIGQPVWVTESSKQAAQPDLSPDGEWIAFSSAGDKQEDIFLVHSDSTGWRQLTDDDYKDRNPRWSPDGGRIAFFSDRGGRYDLWVINPDGSGLQQLTYTSGPNVNNPAIWSPGGTHLAYSVAGGTAYILEVGKSWNEQAPQAIPSMSDPKGWFIAWSWSADERKLAGWQQRDEDTAQRQPGVDGAKPDQWRQRAEGTIPGLVLYSLATQRFERLLDFGILPVWLNDSRRLLFVHQGKLYLVDSLSKRVREVLSLAPHSIGGFSLSRDNRSIYYVLRTTEADIWMLAFESEPRD